MASGATASKGQSTAPGETRAETLSAAGAQRPRQTVWPSQSAAIPQRSVQPTAGDRHGTRMGFPAQRRTPCWYIFWLGTLGLLVGHLESPLARQGPGHLVSGRAWNRIPGLRRQRQGREHQVGRPWQGPSERAQRPFAHRQERRSRRGPGRADDQWTTGPYQPHEEGRAEGPQSADGQRAQRCAVAEVPGGHEAELVEGDRQVQQGHRGSGPGYRSGDYSEGRSPRQYSTVLPERSDDSQATGGVGGGSHGLGSYDPRLATRAARGPCFTGCFTQSPPAASDASSGTSRPQCGGTHVSGGSCPAAYGHHAWPSPERSYAIRLPGHVHRARHPGRPEPALRCAGAQQWQGGPGPLCSLSIVTWAGSEHLYEPHRVAQARIGATISQSAPDAHQRGSASACTHTDGQLSRQQARSQTNPATEHDRRRACRGRTPMAGQADHAGKPASLLVDDDDNTEGSEDKPSHKPDGLDGLG